LLFYVSENGDKVVHIHNRAVLLMCHKALSYLPELK